MKSPIYWHPRVYTIVMKMLCGKDLQRRCSYLQKEAGDLRVLDIGCGDCYLARFISPKRYVGLDMNETFIADARKRGLNVRLFDLRTDVIPESDVIVLANVLHQLYPRHEEILQAILAGATRKAIIVEPTHHIASSGNPLVSWIARRMNDPGYGSPLKRLNEEELFGLFRKYNVTRIETVGREAIAVFERTPV